MTLVRTWIDRLMRVGTRPSDSPEQLLRSATLTISTSLITVLAVGWVVTYAVLGLWISAAFPLAYQVISIASLMALARTKRRDLFRTSQIGAVLLLPFLMQWSLGGFVASSGVMLWALLAPLGALLLQPERALRWFAGYLALAVASGALEPVLALRAAAIPGAVSVTFFVLNVAAVSAIAFIQLRYYMRARERALTALAEEHRLLELEREKSKLAALGTMAAGLMHEAQQPRRRGRAQRGAVGGDERPGTSVGRTAARTVAARSRRNPGSARTWDFRPAGTRRARGRDGRVAGSPRG